MTSVARNWTRNDDLSSPEHPKSTSERGQLMQWKMKTQQKTVQGQEYDLPIAHDVVLTGARILNPPQSPHVLCRGSVKDVLTFPLPIFFNGPPINGYRPKTKEKWRNKTQKK